MSKLKEIIEEIKDVGELFNGAKNEDIKQSYNQYVEKIIMDDAEISQQDYLFKYWEGIKNQNEKHICIWKLEAGIF